MVDFNNEGTVSKPPKEVVALIILEKLYNYLEADETYTKQKLGGAAVTAYFPRARLRTLFLICQPMLQRSLKAEEYDTVNKVCTDLNEKIEPAKIHSCYLTLLAVLDKLELTKLDTRPIYDRTRVEKSNKQHGYG